MHLREQELLRFQQRQMSADELLLTDRHLSTCNDCAQRLVELPALAGAVLRIQRELAQAEAEPCAYFSDEQKEDYLNGRFCASEMPLAKMHLEHCAECCLAVAELQALKESLTPALAGFATSPGVWESLHAWFAIPTSRWVWRGLGTVATATLLVWFGTSNWRGRGMPPPAPVSSPAPSAPHPPNADGQSHAPNPAAQPQAVQELPAVAPKIVLPKVVLPKVVLPKVVLPKVVLLDAGQQVALNATDQLLGLEALSASVQAVVKDALRTQQIKVSRQVMPRRADKFELLGSGRESAGFVLLSPVGQVVPSTRPVLKWQALNGAASYFVNVYDANLRKVASSGALTVTVWQPEVELERGRSYYWQVRALKDEQEFFAPAPSAPDVKFKVLESAQLAQIEQTKAARNSQLALGVLYAQAGMLEEAEREFKALAAANPHSPVAQRILQNFMRQSRGMRP
jgi:hypothetical protein